MLEIELHQAAKKKIRVAISGMIWVPNPVMPARGYYRPHPFDATHI
jgi:hypothetical protein